MSRVDRGYRLQPTEVGDWLIYWTWADGTESIEYRGHREKMSRLFEALTTPPAMRRR